MSGSYMTNEHTANPEKLNTVSKLIVGMIANGESIPKQAVKEYNGQLWASKILARDVTSNASRSADTV